MLVNKTICWRQPFVKQDTKMIQSRFPVSDRHRPFFSNVPQCQVLQLEHGLVTCEGSASVLPEESGDIIQFICIHRNLGERSNENCRTVGRKFGGIFRDKLRNIHS